jgi:hypothetical protein
MRRFGFMRRGSNTQWSPNAEAFPLTLLPEVRHQLQKVFGVILLEYDFVQVPRVDNLLQDGVELHVVLHYEFICLRGRASGPEIRAILGRRRRDFFATTTLEEAQRLDAMANRDVLYERVDEVRLMHVESEPSKALLCFVRHTANGGLEFEKSPLWSAMERDTAEDLRQQLLSIGKILRAVDPQEKAALLAQDGAAGAGGFCSGFGGFGPRCSTPRCSTAARWDDHAGQPGHDLALRARRKAGTLG